MSPSTSSSVFALSTAAPTSAGGASPSSALAMPPPSSDAALAPANAIDNGIPYFDTASMYGNGASEQNLGRVLRELNAWGKVAVGTKLRLRGDDLKDVAGAVRRSVEASLSRLNHESVDLIQL